MDFQFILLEKNEELISAISNSFPIEITGKKINVKGKELAINLIEFIEDNWRKYSRKRTKYELHEPSTGFRYIVETKEHVKQVLDFLEKM